MTFNLSIRPRRLRGSAPLRHMISETHLAATDLELSIACQVGAKVQEEGAFALPARLLADLVNALPSERIDLSQVDGSLHLACGRNEADVKGIDAQEFPALSAIEGEHTLEIDPTGYDGCTIDRYIEGSNIYAVAGCRISDGQLDGGVLRYG